MKVWVSGQNRGESAEAWLLKAEEKLKEQGCIVASCRLLMELRAFEPEDLAHIRRGFIDACDAVYFLKDWKGCKECVEDYYYAKEWRKAVMMEDGEELP